MIPDQRILEKADSEFVDTFKVGSKQYILILSVTILVTIPNRWFMTCRLLPKNMSDIFSSVNGVDWQNSMWNIIAFQVSLLLILKFVTQCRGEHSYNSPSSAPDVICCERHLYHLDLPNYAGVYHSIIREQMDKRLFLLLGPTLTGASSPDKCHGSGITILRLLTAVIIWNIIPMQQ